MTLSVTHSFVSAVSDSTNSSVVRPSNWNAAHAMTGALPPENGGTGIVNDPLNTITINGAYAITYTLSGITGVTLPTSGTLAALNNANTWTAAQTFSEAVAASSNLTVSASLTANSLTVSSNATIGSSLTANSLTVSSNATVGSSLTTNTLTVSSNATIGASLTTNTLTVSSNAIVTHNLTVSSSLEVSGRAYFSSNAVVSGALSVSSGISGSNNITITKAAGTLSETMTAAAGTVQISYSGLAGTAYYFLDTTANTSNPYFFMQTNNSGGGTPVGVTRLQSLSAGGVTQHTFLSFNHGGGNMAMGVATPPSTNYILQSTGVVLMHQFYANSSEFLIRNSPGLNNGAAAQVATITNGPTAGNPTKWIPIDDNGTTRYIPAW